MWRTQGKGHQRGRPSLTEAVARIEQEDHRESRQHLHGQHDAEPGHHSDPEARGHGQQDADPGC